MTVSPNSSSGGGAEGTRLELTGPEKKTGRAFWKFYAVLLLFLVIALAVMAGVMLTGPAESPSPPAESTEPAPTPAPPTPDRAAPEPAAPAAADEPAPAAETETAAPDPAAEVFLENKNGDQPPSLLLAQNTAAEPVKIGDIYQDADGVWRNRPALVTDNTVDSEFYQDAQGVWRNRQPTPAQTRSSNSEPNLGGLLGQIMGAAAAPESGSSAPTDILSGLLTSGALDGLVGGELLNAESLEALGGLLNSGGGLEPGAIPGLESGDISGLIQMMDKVLGGSGGLAASGAGRESAAPPRGNVVSSGSAPLGRPAAAVGGESGLRLEDYEYFDPATAVQIESDWEFFDGSPGTRNQR